MSEIWCGIPVYNNAGTIVDVVKRCLQQIADVIVIDDGSTDADLRDLLKPLNVSVIRHPTNLGKGAALLTAFDYATQHGAKYLITLDGDGQHFPEDIAHFLPSLAPGTILIGSRREVVGSMPGSSRFGREFSDFWICIESGAKVSDTQSGFRVYPLQSASELPLHSRHYNLEVEVVTRAIWAGMKMQSVPIRVRYLEADERVSSFRPLLDNARISLVHARLVLRQLLPIPHRRLFPPEPGGDTIPGLFRAIWFENATPLGLAAAAALSALLGILLWPWGVVPVAYLAIRLHLNKIVSLMALALCIPKSIPALSARIGASMVRSGSGPQWARFVGAHVVAVGVVPVLAIAVYAIARRFQPIAPASGRDFS